MNVEIIKHPVYIIKIEDFFPKQINKHILKEAVDNENNFKDSETGRGLDKEYRNNKVCYYDEIYINDRSKSFLLSTLDGKFKNDSEFRELISTSKGDLSDFLKTNYHETQVSRYGLNEHYNWHQDVFSNFRRHITIVYYFFKEPQKWRGGEISFTDSPAFRGNLFEKKPSILTIKPKNNMAVIFSSKVLHNVSGITSSPKVFVDGRFSANIWVGFQ